MEAAWITCDSFGFSHKQHLKFAALNYSQVFKQKYRIGMFDYHKNLADYTCFFFYFAKVSIAQLNF